MIGRVWKKSGSGGFEYTRILGCRVRVCRVLKKVGFRREISGSGIPGLITNLCWENASRIDKNAFYGALGEFSTDLSQCMGVLLYIVWLMPK